ncbi:MAG: hypothetical protein BGP05_21900 [Rhizobiales bacterium 62-47]|nr:MAG: hypothetical protein BGP05_21900 [Rhizobiales bacterium 62-47]
MHTGTAQQHARRKKLIAALLAAPAHERCDQGIDQVPTAAPTMRIVGATRRQSYERRPIG